MTYPLPDHPEEPKPLLGLLVITGLVAIALSSVVISIACPIYNVFILMVSVPALAIVSALLGFAGLLFTRRPRLLQTLVILPSLAFTPYIVHSMWQDNSPEGTFTRLLEVPLPSSVRHLEKHGHSAMAGASESLVFEIAPKDFPFLLASEHFKELSNESDRPDSVQALAEQHGITPTTVYMTGDNLVHILIVTNAKKNRVLVHYSKI